MEIACRAFIFWKNKILLCKQKKPPRNFWVLPGGSLEEGETLFKCISREITEEIGITLEIDQMLFVREMINSSRHRIEFYFSTIVPESRKIFDDIKACSEIGDVCFFSLEELLSITYKPECLPSLIQEIIDKSSTFPRYLGNVS